MYRNQMFPTTITTITFTLLLSAFLACSGIDPNADTGGSDLVAYRGVISDPFSSGAKSTLGFGQYNSNYGGYHTAIDLSVDIGDVALAPCRGSIVGDLQVAGYGSACNTALTGWVTLLECQDEARGYTVLLGHCKAVANGTVQRGSPICAIQPFPGIDCSSDWSHLHLSVRFTELTDMLYRGYSSIQDLNKYWVDPTLAPPLEDEYIAVCGNHQIDSGEQCDGSNLNGASCVTLGYTSGSIQCNANCTFNASACENPPETAIMVNPNLGNWTPDFTAQTDCTCSTADTDCYTLYRGSVVSVSGNWATVAFQKASGFDPPQEDIHYWVVVTEEQYPICTERTGYVARSEGTWSANQGELVVQQVPIWPDQASFDSAPCNAQKSLFIITGGSGGLNHERIWFQKQALVFTKTCQ